MKRNIVVAITGASGVTYSVRLLEVLLAAGCDVHLSISAAGQVVLKQELGLSVDLDNFSPAMLMLDAGDAPRSEAASLAKHRRHLGRFEQRARDGPASRARCTTTTSAIAGPDRQRLVPDRRHGRLPMHGRHARRDRPRHKHESDSPRRRRSPERAPSADSRAARNAAVAGATAEHDARRRSGAVILPAMPGFYHGVKLISDLVDFIVSRICDQLGVANSLVERWGERELVVSGQWSGISG